MQILNLFWVLCLPLIFIKVYLQQFPFRNYLFSQQHQTIRNYIVHSTFIQLLLIERFFGRCHELIDKNDVSLRQMITDGIGDIRL